MSTVQLQDIYDPTLWARTTQEASIVKNTFLSSGIVVNDPLITQMLSGGSDAITLPQYNGIIDGEPNYSSDDPTQNSTPQKITSKTQTARSASRNNSWAAMDLARELTDSDPVAAITNRIGGYWATDDEKRLIYSMKGILAGNIANDGGDMVLDVSNDTTATVTDAERIGGGALIEAEQTLGDHKESIVGYAMHSALHSRLRRQGLLVDNFDPATGTLLYTTYLGKRVIVDDSLAPVVGTNKLTYTVALFGAGAFGYGTGKVLNPSEIERLPSSGNGAGQTAIYSRVNTCFHPSGYQFTGAAVADKFAKYSELELAANWSRVVARKNVPLAFLKVND